MKEDSTSVKIVDMLIGALSILLLIFQISCQQSSTDRSVQVASYEVNNEIEDDIIVGAERIAIYHPMLEGKRVACVVNHTSKVGENHLIDTLLKLNVDVVKVFAPEHGFRGKLSDGEHVNDGIDKESGLPIQSLYGKNKKPSLDMLNGIDILLFDIQDVGVRFYTYLSTMHYIMEAGAENNIPVIILDRPNPHMDYIDGPVLESEFSSFVGLHPVPVVYGMTIGEYAQMINGERWLNNGVQVDLTVIECKNLSRSSYYEFSSKPSPNLPNMRSILLYPSICFFEGTTVSVGRGTDHQFQVLGHPALNEKPYSFTPLPNEGSKYPPQEGNHCFGDHLENRTIGSLMDYNSLDLSYLLEYYRLITDKGEDFFLETNHFNRLAGTDLLKRQIIENKSEAEIKESWKEGLDQFREIRAKYLIYPSEDK